MTRAPIDWERGDGRVVASRRADVALGRVPRPEREPPAPDERADIETERPTNDDAEEADA